MQLNGDQNVTEVESLCMNCYQKGVTRILLTKIPFFREVIVMAFSCPHCNYRSNEIQSGATIQRLGVRYTLNVTRPEDLNRTVVKADSASVLLPHLEFEIPAQTQKGSLDTVEGLLRTAADGLEQLQPQRRAQYPEVAAKIDAVIGHLRKCSEGSELPFVLVLDDPAGNSFIENPAAPSEDPELSVAHYKRSHEQNEALCLNDTEDEGTLEEELEKQKAEMAEEQLLQDQSQDKQKDSYLSLVPKEKDPHEITKGLPVPEDAPTVTQEQEVVTLPEMCPACSAKGEVRSVLTKIPYFKDVVIMAFTCDKCGYKSNEVHASGEITGFGKRITLHVKDPLDMTRSLLKSDTCTLSIPEAHLELSPGTLGSKFTTVEGMLDSIITHLSSSPFIVGDSADKEKKNQIDDLVKTLQLYKKGETPFTMILDDPLSNSHIQNPHVPDADPQLLEETYELSWKQKEELGINDMRTVEDKESKEYLAPTISHKKPEEPPQEK